MNEKKFTHSMNYQKNPRNIYLTRKVIQNILYKCGIYDEVQNLAIYQRSLTHKSYVVNDKNSVLKYEFLDKGDNNLIVPYQKESNERLEFLGDSIIGHIVCEYLYNRYPDKDEGFLTKLKTRLVDRKSLAIFSRYINISDYILISNHMENIHGRNTDKILEDVFESLICAMNEDLGFGICKKFVLNILENTTNFANLLYNDINFKDRLLRFFQKNGWAPPIYKTSNVIGPPHKRSFTMEAWKIIYDSNSNNNMTNNKKVIIDEEMVGIGTSSSKKEAEQIASKAALKEYGLLNSHEY